MASDPHGDDDAFRWEGDDDRAAPAARRTSHASAAAQPITTPPITKRPAQAEPSTEDTDDAAERSDGPAASLGNVALVSMGLLGGIYLLYTVGWVLGGIRMLDAGVFLVPAYAVVPVVWVAVAACALWFGATMLLTRHAAAWVRFAWLVAGVFLLVPWPFVMGV